MRALVFLLAWLLPVGAHAGALQDQVLRSTGLAPYAFNLKYSNTRNFRTAWRSGSGNAIVAFNGDSTVRGVDETASPYNAQYSINDVAAQLAGLLAGAGTPSGANNWFGISGTSLNDYVIRDSRLTVGGGTILGSNKVQGGTEIRFPAVASTASFTPTASVDTCEIYWGDQGTSGRTFSYQVDSGSAVNIPTTGTARIAKTSFSLGSLGAHTINLAWVSGGTTTIYGVNCYNSTRREISLWQMGISGGTSANMVDNGGAPGAGRIQQLTNFPPAMVVTEMGIVNDWRTSVASTTTQANTDSFITQMQALNIDVVLLIPPFDNGTSTGLTARQEQYVAAMYAEAMLRDVPLIDMRAKWRSYGNAVALGWQVSTDNVHPDKAGYGDEAAVLLKVLNAIQ